MKTRLGPGLLPLPFLLLVACGGPSDDPGPVKGRGNGAPARAGPGDPNVENPDRGRWVDLGKHPFRPEWVGGTLVLARGDTPGTLNNLLRNQGEATVIAKNFLYPFLLSEVPDRVNGVLTFEPQVAASLPEMKADRRTWIWKLRPDLTWQDGEPLTAHDYAFTWSLLQNKDVRADARRASLEHIENVEALDDHTIKVVYKEPYYRAVANFGLEFAVVPRHWALKDPELFNKSRWHPAYGPYRIVTYNDERLHLELRPEYRRKPWPPRPHYIENVEYRFVRDTAANLQLMKKGVVHLCIINYDQFEELGKDVEFQKRSWRTFYSLPVFYFIAWNTADPRDKKLQSPHPLFGDARVRRAMAHLVPRERILAEYFYGRGTLVTGPYFYMEEGYDPAIPQIRHDPGKALELLAQAGWHLDTKGHLQKGERTFRFALLRPAGRRAALDPAVTLLQEEARKVGMAMEVRPMAFREMIKRLSSHRFDAAIAGFSHRPPFEPDVAELFHSRHARTEGNNWGCISDRAVDELIDAYRGEMDFRKRVAIRQRLHRRLWELQPYTFLYSPASSVGISRTWANVKVHDLGVWFRDFVLRELWERFPPDRGR